MMAGEVNEQNREMKPLWRKVKDFTGKIFNLLIRGKFSLALYSINLELPDWIFAFNKATILKTDKFEFPKKINDNVRVRVANHDDIGHIHRISGVAIDHIKQMMDRGAVCYLASVNDRTPEGLTWSVRGRIYVRGLAFEHDVGPYGYYSIGSVTLPTARGQGLYLKVNSEKVKIEIQNGARYLYGTVEFTNEYSYGLRIKLGYKPILFVTYIKILFVKFCIVREIDSRRISFRIILKEPKNDVIII